MEAIVAVYADWGIGKDGLQPLTLSADRQFFREMTLGKTVLMGRRTMEALPGKKPLSRRVNVVLTHSRQDLPGFLCTADFTQFPDAVVIGGGSIYARLLPLCSRAYVTKIAASVPCDTFFPNLDENPHWRLEQVLQQGTEQGIPYQICSYVPGIPSR